LEGKVMRRKNGKGESGIGGKKNRRLPGIKSTDCLAPCSEREGGVRTPGRGGEGKKQGSRRQRRKEAKEESRAERGNNKESSNYPTIPNCAQQKGKEMAVAEKRGRRGTPRPEKVKEKKKRSSAFVSKEMS